MANCKSYLRPTENYVQTSSFTQVIPFFVTSLSGQSGQNITDSPKQEHILAWGPCQNCRETPVKTVARPLLKVAPQVAPAPPGQSPWGRTGPQQNRVITTVITVWITAANYPLRVEGPPIGRRKTQSGRRARNSWWTGSHHQAGANWRYLSDKVWQIELSYQKLRQWSSGWYKRPGLTSTQSIDHLFWWRVFS